MPSIRRYTMVTLAESGTIARTATVEIDHELKHPYACRKVFDFIDHEVGSKIKYIVLSPERKSKGFEVKNGIYDKSDFRLWLKSKGTSLEGSSSNSCEEIRSD